jgi:hypothetical protein
MFALAKRSQQTVLFLLMAAAEMRRIAERVPEIEIAAELRHMASELEAEANDLPPRDGE